MDLTENDGYLKRNLEKFGLRMCAPDEEADYVLIDSRSDVAEEKAAKEAMFLISYDGSLAEEQVGLSVIWRGVYEGKGVQLTITKKVGV